MRGCASSEHGDARMELKDADTLTRIKVRGCDRGTYAGAEDALRILVSSAPSYLSTLTPSIGYKL
jgi:hypothetical protein